MERPRRSAGARLRGGLFWAFVLFLYGPFVAIFVLAFQGPLGGLTFPLNHPSTFWFGDLVNPHQLSDFRPSMLRSFVLALGVMAVTVIVSLLAGLAFRRRFHGASLVFYLTVASLIVPSILVSIGISLGFRMAAIVPAWYSAGFGAQLTWTLPFGVLIMFSVFNRFDRSVEEAARDLGASEFQVLRHVTVPLIAPGLLAVALLGFNLAYDEFPRTSIVSGATNTLPLELVAFMAVHASPAIYALAVLTTLVSLILVVAVFLSVGRMRRKNPHAAP
jgi:putative spermidine/putrescine transport system permease protein